MASLVNSAKYLQENQDQPFTDSSRPPRMKENLPGRLGGQQHPDTKANTETTTGQL